ncbi:hypothetical protein C474_16049 [Halogeometricum pallidum JCM 14848]|uniref:Uncharacterized protein n=1 Tax=Halogeometricum pallidum JCM 14848 TaxID=1227487 RepID=M0D1M2_HALPD|nr:hypothetical protein [Halogeometricum pallidum]ELZ28029.1 hypothetical protein C474_16049 [Halogeometricum pallidum JCM 14848]
MTDDASDGTEYRLPPSLRDRIDELGLQELREVVHYAQDRIRTRHRPVSEQIEAAPGEEVLSVEEGPEYTEVVKREPCGENCPDCPHGPYLYHVYEETLPDGSDSLHWVFLGHLFRSPRVAETSADSD